MKHCYRALSIILLFSFMIIFWSSDAIASVNANHSKLISIDFYYSPTCPHCHKVLSSGLLNEIQKYDVKVNKILADEKFWDVVKKYSIEPAVPTAIFHYEDHDKALQGDLPIINQLKEEISELKSQNENIIKESSVSSSSNVSESIKNASQQNANSRRGYSSYTVLNITNKNKSFENFKNKTPLVLVILTALSDSVNPCIMSVLILLLSYLVMLKRKKDVLKYGFLFIFIVFLTYYLIGVGIVFGVEFISKIFSLTKFSFYLTLFVALICFIAGLINIKDFFAYGKGISFQLSKEHKKFVQKVLRNLSIISILILAVFITIVEFPCSGIMYLGIISYFQSVLHMPVAMILTYLLLYNLIFVLPLFVIIILVLKGYDVKRIENMRLKERRLMRLILGLGLILLSIILVMNVI